MAIDQGTGRGRIVAAALQLAAERPWRDVTLCDIAERAGCNLVELRGEFSSKGAILAAFTRLIDDAVLAAAPKRDAAQSPRDALFEVVMARIDALAPYRAAIRSIRRSGVWEPAQMKALLASQSWMLAAAGIGNDGPEGRLKAAGLASVYASVMQTWLEDDDPGLAKTMAVLDRRLNRGERTMASLEEMKQAACKLAGIFRGARSGTAEAARGTRASGGATAAQAPDQPSPAGGHTGAA